MKKTQGKTEDKKRTVYMLIDSHALIHRAYHAMPYLQTKTGVPSGALYGLTNMLLQAIDKFKPDHIYAANDLPKTTFRAMWKPDVCFYHHPCDDGFGSALIVQEKWPECRMFGVAYGAPLPVFELQDRNLLVVDFSFKQDEMRRLAGRAASVVVLDHHKTAEAELFPWSIGGKEGPPVDRRF
jgi:hypothetical protein